MYTNNKTNNNQEIDLLLGAINSGIINLETVREQMQMQERTQILREHSDSIWQGKTNKHWFVYLPDAEKGRVRKERKTREEIEDIVVDFYSNKDCGESSVKQQAKPSNPKTLETLFPEWFDFKSKTGSADSYIMKIYDHWEKYYIDDPIIKKDIRELNRIDLELWANEMVKRCKYSKTEYYNATVIIRQSLEYAVEKGYIAKSPFGEFKIDKKLFNKQKKKEDKTQVFLTDEQPKVEAVCWDKFNKRPKYVSALAIPLAFRLGVRVGELTVLRESDIEGDYIHIQREEVLWFLRKQGILRPIYNGTKVVEHTKSDAGDRLVPLTPEAKMIINKVLASNKLYGNHCEDYLFVCGNKRVMANTIDKKLYGICEEAGVPKKSMHKIRKTYISTLVDGDVNINSVRRLVGHESETTTYKSYVFDRSPKGEVENKLADILDSTSSNTPKTHQKLTKTA